MVRTFLYLVAGLLLGVVIHLIVILALPSLASNNVATKLAAFGQVNRTVVLDDVVRGAANPLRLDPEVAYAVCRLDLTNAPGELAGTLPLAYWSVAVYDRSGTVLYSATNRDGIGQTLDIGVFDPAQTRLLAEQKINVAEGLLIVESKGDEVYVVVRLAPAHQVMRKRYKEQLAKLGCRNIKL